MHVIKMNNDKSLVTTIRARIHQNEKNADTLVFLLPMEYEGVDIKSCSVLLGYVLPNDVQKFEKLVVDEEPYKNHYRYHLKVDTSITSTSGEVALWLSFLNSENDYVLKSGKTSITVYPLGHVDEGIKDDDSVIEFDEKDDKTSEDEVIEFDDEVGVVEENANNEDDEVIEF